MSDLIHKTTKVFIFCNLFDYQSFKYISAFCGVKFYCGIRQGFAPHVSPFTDVRDLGNLLAQAGFTMLTIVSCFSINFSINQMIK